MKDIFAAMVLIAVACALGAAGCSSAQTGDRSQPSTAAEAESPAAMTYFDTDSAMSLIREQTDMGPRVPGSASHDRCTDWIVDRLHMAGAENIAVQRARVTQPLTGVDFDIANVFGQVRPDAPKRILLVAHYDTRPTADEESDPAKRDTPIDGANDGASGVAMVLELAREVAADTTLTGIGLDLLLVDCEDSGLNGDGQADTEATWCLGSQYWAENMPYADFKSRPVAGIVFDMVGGRQARFHREYFSNAASPSLVDKVWAAAASEGFGTVFVNRPGGPIIDDHLPIQRAGISCIDIVENRSEVTGSFPPTWHTLDDNINNIDSETIEAVGRTMMRYLRDTARR